ncbi:DUF3363 domain-containing protein [Sphingomonas sp. RT2P30]|uniref:DUF3363 domain-containing protein n=1 Tax=Parasphingomonas halimpatiens TaxID=3096162 RepID=UPI002FCC2153
MAQDDDHFEARPGRIRSKGGRDASLRAQILARTARLGGNPRRVGAPSPGGGGTPRTGRFNARGRGAKFAAAFPRGNGWSFDSRSGTRVRPRRVAVKARVVKLAGKAGAVAAHLRYLERDGVSRDGEPGRFYSTFADTADGKGFAERGLDDRHQFRFIVAPEDGAKFDTLKTVTRDLMAQMEKDLGTNLDWVAVDHFDTGHPHTHVIVRGVTEDGKTLNIAGDYIAHGVRHRAAEIMTRALGPQSELELREQLAHEVDAERLTRLDRAILERAENNVIDLRQDRGAAIDNNGFQQLLVSRARQLERMDLAEPHGNLTWSIAPDLEKSLSDLGRRGDIIRTMHKAMERGPQGRRPELYAIHDPARDSAAVIGQVVARGTAGEYHDRSWLIVDGIDGRTHYVDVGSDDQLPSRGSLVRLDPRPVEPRQSDRTIAEIAGRHDGQYSVAIHLADDPGASEDFARAHVRRLEAIRRATGAVERNADGSWTIAPDHLDRVADYERARAGRSPIAITTLSTMSVGRQTTLEAPTWLDKELAASEPLALAGHGFGKDMARALYQRQQWLVDRELADIDGDRLTIRPGMSEALSQRAISNLVGQLSRNMGMEGREAVEYERVDGVYRRSVEAGSKRFALIEKSREFVLVPWRPEMERYIGRQMTGIAHGDAMSWELGRGRAGPSIGM